MENKRAAKPKREICVWERYDRGGAERGQHNQQCIMEEEANHLYRRPQITGQARDEEEEEVMAVLGAYGMDLVHNREHKKSRVTI